MYHYPSDSKLVRDWLFGLSPETQFTVFDIPETIGTRGTRSSAIIYSEKKGLVECVGMKEYIDPRGTKRVTKLYAIGDKKNLPRAHRKPEFAFRNVKARKRGPRDEKFKVNKEIEINSYPNADLLLKHIIDLEAVVDLAQELIEKIYQQIKRD